MYYLMYPVKNAPGEIQTVYFIWVIPKWVAQAFGLGILGLLIVFILEKLFLKKLNGNLIFSENQICFNSNRISFDIKLASVRSIYFVPKKNLITKKETHRLTIIKKKKGEKIYFKLLEENEFAALFQQLLLLEDKVMIKAEPDDFVTI